ncbi:MAG: hypothetical protein WBE26_17015 [Phycisphaerae bacterium]
MNHIIGRLACLVALAGLSFLFVGTTPARAQATFDDNCGTDPVPCDDQTNSLGHFEIWVLPPYHPLMTGCPGWNPVTGILTSPTLYDPNTVIGRSAGGTDAEPIDATGRMVGLMYPESIADGQLVRPIPFPDPPPLGHMFLEGPPDTREVHTEVVVLDMTDGAGTHVRVGQDQYGLLLSPGEVESKQDAPVGGNDFPAESFFDIFAEVEFPACGGLPGATVVLYNHAATPLVVVNDHLISFPPRVVYIHGASQAVPILFRNDAPDAPPSWLANMPFGFMKLAGHGVAPRDNPWTPGDYEEEIWRLQGFVPMPSPPPTVECDGTESGGTGVTSCGSRMYAYPVTDSDGSMTDLYIGTDHCIEVDNYANWCEPSGWTHEIIAGSLQHYTVNDHPVKTAHGRISPGPTGNCSCMIHWSGPALGGSFTFGFDFVGPDHCVHDVEWQAVDDNGTYTANWDLHVGYGVGPVHGPGLDDVCIPTVTEWGLVVMVLLVLAAGTVVIFRRRAMMA